MSLQYRTRNMWEDRLWQQRVRLSQCLIVETVDWWCRNDVTFPLSETIAAVLFLFSPRCDPLRVPETNIRQHMAEHVGAPRTEYIQTWPQHPESRGTELIDRLSQIFNGAVHDWSAGSMLTPTIESVKQQIVDGIVTHHYVVFRHHQTTSRDFGGFHGHG